MSECDHMVGIVYDIETYPVFQKLLDNPNSKALVRLDDFGERFNYCPECGQKLRFPDEN